MTRLMIWSESKKNTEAATAISTTMAVVTKVSRRLGQVTFETSDLTCCRNSKGLVRAMSSQCKCEVHSLR